MCSSLALMIRSKFLLMGSVHDPSSTLMEGWGVTDNLNSCLSWGALQNSILLVKHTCALHPAPSQERSRRKSETLGPNPSSVSPYPHLYDMDFPKPLPVVEGSTDSESYVQKPSTVLTQKSQSRSAAPPFLFPRASPSTFHSMPLPKYRALESKHFKAKETTVYAKWQVYRLSTP